MDPKDTQQSETDALETDAQAPEAEAPDIAEGALAALDDGLTQADDEPGDDDDLVAPEDSEPEKGEGEKAEPEAPAEGQKEAGASEPKQTAEEEAADLGVKNERAKARFIELRAAAEELEALKGESSGWKDKAEQYDQMLGHIESTGATPEQYSSVMGYLHAVNRGSPQELAQVREALAKELEWLDGKLGRGDDAYMQHDDLRQAVEDGTIDAAYAREIAQTRNIQTAQQRHHQELTERQQQEQQQLQAQTQQAVAALNAIGERLAQQDPQFNERVEIAKQAFMARRDSLPPSAWASEFLLDYQAAVVPQQPVRRAPVGSVPLRPSGSAGSLGKQPSSPLEALDMALEDHARRRA